MKSITSAVLILLLTVSVFTQGGMGPGPGRGNNGGGACTTPDCVAGGPALWLEADTLSLSDTDPVGAWTDSGTGGNNASASGAARPLFQTAVINGLPIVEFDGIQNWMSITDTAALEMNTDSTVFVVMASIGTFNAANVILAKDAAAASAGAYALLTDSAGKLELDRPFIEAGVPSTNATVAGTFYLICAKVSGTSVSHYLDGTANGTDTLATGTATNEPLRIGAINTGSLGAWGQINVAELIIYNSALSDGDRDIVEAYVATKYALTIALYPDVRRLLLAA